MEFTVSVSVKGQKETHNVSVWQYVNTNTILFSCTILGYEPTPSFFISNVIIQVSKNQ